MPQGNPKPGELYRHFKQKMYQVLTTAVHSETGEELVIYQALYGDFKTYARPLELFISPADRQKYPDAGQEYRFQLINTETLAEPEGFKAFKADEMAEPPVCSTPEEKMMAFLDTEDLEEKYKVLLTMRECITGHMINNMAVVLDLVIEDGPLEERYEELKRCLQTLQRYETSRLR